MAKETLAVYDPCQEYLSHFLAYLKHKNLPYEVIGFSELSILERYVETKKLSGVLFSPGEKQSYSEKIIEKTKACLANIEKKHGCKILLLLGETEQEGIPYPVIEKYQSMEQILAEIQVQLAEQLTPAVRKANLFENCILAGLYSPAEKVSHPHCAAYLKERLVREEGVNGACLYLNFEAFSGINSYLDFPRDTDISDLIYLYKTSPQKLPEILQQKKGRFREMDVLTAPVLLEDLGTLEGEAWPGFLSAILQAGDYHILILDLFSFHHSILELIFQYGTLYIPALPYFSEQGQREHLAGRTRMGEDFSQAKLQEFRRYFFDHDQKDRLSRILELRMNEEINEIR